MILVPTMALIKKYNNHQGNINDIDNNTPPIREQTGPKLWICKLLNIHILIPTTSLKDITLL